MGPAPIAATCLPVRSMSSRHAPVWQEGGPSELFGALDVRGHRGAELADGTDEGARSQRLPFAVSGRITTRQMESSSHVAPVTWVDKRTCGADVVLGHHAGEVLQDFRLLGVEVRPVVDGASGSAYTNFVAFPATNAL